MKTLIISFAGLSPAVTRNLDGPTRIRLFIAAIALLFAATVSGFFFANTFSNLCFQGRYFWALFAGWFGFTWLIDVQVLMSGGARAVVFVRLGICVLLGIFNSLTVDVQAFRSDITNYLDRTYNKEVAALDSTFQHDRIAPVEQAISDLQERNVALFAEIQRSHDRVFREYNGEEGTPRGDGDKYYFKLKNFHQPDSILKRAEITRNDTAIAHLDRQQQVILTDLQVQRDAIVSPTSAGLRDSVNAMHKMVWGPDGTFSDRVFFACFFLIGFILEAMVLIVKAAARKALGTYERIASQMSETAEAGIISRHEQDEEITNAEANGRHQVSVNRMTEEYMRESYRSHQTIAVDEIEGKIHKAVKEEEAIHEAVLAAQRRNQRMKEEMGDGMYEDFGQDVYDRSLAIIRKELDRLAANSKRTTKEPA